MKKCMELEEKLKTMDREISTNPQYVQKVNTESMVFSARQHICYSALYAIAHPSVCPSHGWIS